MIARNLLFIVPLLVSAVGSAADAPGRTVAKSLVVQDLPQFPGKEATMLTVEYPPGVASAPHRHDAEVFLYVLEGSVVMQVDGSPPQTLTVGQTFHEAPGDVHRTSANASKTAPAKILVFMVKDKAKPITTPVTQ